MEFLLEDGAVNFSVQVRSIKSKKDENKLTQKFNSSTSRCETQIKENNVVVSGKLNKDVIQVIVESITPPFQSHLEIYSNENNKSIKKYGSGDLYLENFTKLEINSLEKQLVKLKRGT